jgi:hypothetical protein
MDISRFARCCWLLLLCLSSVAIPFRVEATGVARPCKPEPTDEVISYGDLIACEIGTIGDSDTFRFAGLPNEKVVIVSGKTGGGGNFFPCIELFGPTGARLSSACSIGRNRIDFLLTQAGTYTVLVADDNNTEIGTYFLALERISPLPRFGAAIKYGETLTGQTIDLAGDMRFLAFSGTIGSRISTAVTKSSGSSNFFPCTELFGPNGTRLSSACSVGTNRIDATLTQDGTHILLVNDDNQTETGTYSATLQCLVGSCTDAIPTSVGAAVSPPSLSTPVGTTVNASATIRNSGSAGADAAGADTDGPGTAAVGASDALSCGITQLTGAPTQFFYQATDPSTGQLIGSPNTPVNILPGGSQSFQVSLTPTAAFCPTDIKFGFGCSNAGFADVLTGVNTVLLTSGSSAACGLRTSASVSQPTLAVGQTLTAGGSATNLGVPGTAADFYVGILGPDNSIQFLTSGGTVVGTLGDFRSFRPLAVNVPLNAPFSVSQPAIVTHQRTAGDLRGSYVFFVAAVKTGALAGGTLANDQILSVTTAPYSFP